MAVYRYEFLFFFLKPLSGPESLILDPVTLANRELVAGCDQLFKLNSKFFPQNSWQRRKNRHRQKSRRVTWQS